jgi:hypothetical protein
MDWNKLLSTKRMGRPVEGNDASEPRTEFPRVCDRIVAVQLYQRIHGISLP